MAGRALPRVAIGAILLAAATSLFLQAVVAQENDGGIDLTRGSLAEWVENRRIIAKEKRDLTLAKELLNERIGLVDSEIEALREKIEDAKQQITEADEKRTELVRENDKLKQASASLVTAAADLESRCRALLAQLPEIFQKRVKPLSQQFPEQPEETKLTLSTRYQNILGVLNELNKINREITVTSEVRQLADGPPTEVTVMYVGIAQAYYVDGDRKVAGMGRPSPEGWTWKPANEAAADIALAIAILKKEQPASFIQLPIEIQ